jgi:hypothetical protein
VKSVDWQRRRAAVVPVEGETVARWGARGRGPGYALAQAVRGVLADGRAGARLTAAAQAALDTERQRFAFLGDPDASVVTEDADATRLWTFGGLRCNLALARALAQHGLRSQAARDACVTLPPGCGSALKDSLPGLGAALAGTAVAFGTDLRDGGHFNFAGALPPLFQQEVAIHRLLDVPAAERACAAPLRQP